MDIRDYLYLLQCCFTGWYGIIFVRQSIYQEGIFRFKIIIPENYPDGDCPVRHRISIYSIYSMLYIPQLIWLCYYRLFLINLFFSSEGFLWSICFSSSNWTTSTVWIGCSSRSFEEMASKRQSYLANITLHKESFLQNWYKWATKPRSCRPVS
jgi:hypothetical protein